MAAYAGAAANSGEGRNNNNNNNSNNNSILLTKKTSFRLRSSSLNSVRLRRVFDIFDANGDGVITAAEIGKALILLGLEKSEDDVTSGSAIDSIISSFVKPGNQGLTFDDFVALHSAVNDTVGVEDQELPFEDAEEEIDDRMADEVEEEEEVGGGCAVSQEEADLTEAFKVFDEDGDGYISAKELQVVLDKLGLPEAREMERVERMILSVDQNHDGLVDFFEFKDMMRSVMVRSS